jgi:hypothetical protein
VKVVQASKSNRYAACPAKIQGEWNEERRPEPGNRLVDVLNIDQERALLLAWL